MKSYIQSVLKSFINKYLSISLMLLPTSWAFSQEKGEINVTGNFSTAIYPDSLLLAIEITTFSENGKSISLESQEEEIVQRLKSRNLYSESSFRPLENFGTAESSSDNQLPRSSFLGIGRKNRTKKVSSSSGLRSYAITLSGYQELTALIEVLNDVPINKIFFVTATHSKLDEFLSKSHEMALSNARNKASTLLGVERLKIGKTISIRELKDEIKMPTQSLSFFSPSLRPSKNLTSKLLEDPSIFKPIEYCYQVDAVFEISN